MLATVQATRRFQFVSRLNNGECSVPHKPQPIETANIELSPQILEPTERLAENSHDVWAAQRLAEGWTCGPEKNDAPKKRHP